MQTLEQPAILIERVPLQVFGRQAEWLCTMRITFLVDLHRDFTATNFEIVFQEETGITSVIAI
jgi:hypothetical protein